MSKGRWRSIVLVVSLGLNLVFVGLVVARLAFVPGEPPLLWAVKNLDQGTRERIRPLLREQFRETRALRAQLRTTEQNLRDIMRAEPFDEKAAAGALAELRQVTGQFQLQMHETALKLLADLPPEEREKVAGRLLRPRRAEGPPRMQRPDPGSG